MERLRFLDLINCMPGVEGIKRFIAENRPLLGALGGVGITLAVAGYVIERDRADANAYVAGWTDKVNGVLANLDNLPVHKFYPKVRVVAAGRTLEEQIDMQQKKTPVNVRNYPGLVFPNGAGTQVIGLIAQDEIVRNVFISGGWGVFRCRDGGLDLDQLCAVNANNLSAR